VLRRVPKKKATLEEEIEGENVEKDLREAKYRSNRLESSMQRLKANCGYLQETLREELYDEYTRDQNQEIKQKNSQAKVRIQKQLIGMILVQLHNLSKYVEEGTGQEMKVSYAI
jgi:glutamine synthetase